MCYPCLWSHFEYSCLPSAKNNNQTLLKVMPCNLLLHPEVVQDWVHNKRKQLEINLQEQHFCIFNFCFTWTLFLNFFLLLHLHPLPQLRPITMMLMMAALQKSQTFNCRNEKSNVVCKTSSFLRQPESFMHFSCYLFLYLCRLNVNDYVSENMMLPC